MIEIQSIQKPALTILARASSGILNGGFYGNAPVIAAIGLCLTIGFTIWSLIKYKSAKRKVWWILGLIGSILSILGVFTSFIAWTPGIHLFTWLTQAFHFGTIFIQRPSWEIVIVLLMCIFPSVFLQKLSINLIGGNKWNYNGTDDQTGCTYGLLGVKIPRFACGNMYFRLLMSIVSLLILIYHERIIKIRKKTIQSTDSESQ